MDRGGPILPQDAGNLMNIYAGELIRAFGTDGNGAPVNAQYRLDSQGSVMATTIQKASMLNQSVSEGNTEGGPLPAL